MTDNEIIKDLEYKVKHMTSGDYMFLPDILYLISRLTNQNEQLKYELKMMLENAKAYKAEIEKLKKENDDIAYTIVGVMHFVDKWLDGDELKQYEVIRATIMREKTLQITEKLQAEIEKLERIEAIGTKTIETQNAEIERLREQFSIQADKIKDKNNAYEKLEKEVERLNAVSEICGKCHKKYAEKIEQAKSEAIKEFAERLKEKSSAFGDVTACIVHTLIDNLVKEMTEQRKEDEGK